MSDFAAPSGPPPPRVPEGWKAVWNDQYKEWFFVNVHTKQSTWEKPTEPAYANDGPPGYSPGGAPPVSDSKKGHESNNPYGHSGETDEQLAARLQAEEEQRAGRRDRGESDGYYASGQQGHQGGLQPGGYGAGELPPRPTSSQGKSKGLFSKLLGKDRPSQQYSGQGYGQQPQYQQSHAGGYRPQGGYPPQGYGYGPPQGYYGGGYGQGQYAQQPAGRTGGGLGTGGALALGAGGGLLGGMMLGEAMGDSGDGGGDYGGGGGDYGGGDMGGGDMGGGDMGGGM